MRQKEGKEREWRAEEKMRGEEEEAGRVRENKTRLKR